MVGYQTCPFLFKKYNGIKWVSKDVTKFIFVNLCFRTCVCEFGFINIEFVLGGKGTNKVNRNF